MTNLSAGMRHRASSSHYRVLPPLLLAWLLHCLVARVSSNGRDHIPSMLLLRPGSQVLHDNGGPVGVLQPIPCLTPLLAQHSPISAEARPTTGQMRRRHGPAAPSQPPPRTRSVTLPASSKLVLPLQLAPPGRTTTWEDVGDPLAARSSVADSMLRR